MKIPLISYALAISLVGCTHNQLQSKYNSDFPYAIPAFAGWDPHQPPRLRLKVSYLGTSPAGLAAFNLNVSNSGAAACIPKNVVTSRGLAWLVLDQSGKVAAPRQPSPVSPAIPPVAVEAPFSANGSCNGDHMVTTGSAVDLRIEEPAEWIFPGTGLWTLRAKLKLWNAFAPPASPERRLEIISEPVKVTI